MSKGNKILKFSKKLLRFLGLVFIVFFISINLFILLSGRFYLYKGIAFNDPIDPVHGFTGPRFSRISNNRFKRIETQGIFIGTATIGTATNHISIGNQFIDVGNMGNGETGSTGTSIIYFAAAGNVSQADYFERAAVQARLSSSGLVYNPLISGRATIDSFATAAIGIAPGATAYVRRFPITLFAQFATIKYSAQSFEPVDRKGLLRINIGQGNNPAGSVTDDYDYVSNSDGALTWSLAVNSAAQYVDLTVKNDSAYGIALEYQTSLMI